MKRKNISIKKILGITAITIAFIGAGAGIALYVNYAEGLDIEKAKGIHEHMTEIITRQPEFDIETTAGTIRIKLYNKTPEHLKNFERLVEEHYYDSVLFHRVIDGFMIQTGDPNTKDSSKVELYGQGGPGYTLSAEFVPEYTHKKGALAAARRGDRANPKKSSSGSQFYIVQDEENCRHLDGEYTVFGETIDGMDVMDRIAQVPTDPYDRPLEDIRIITIRPVEKEVKETLDSLADAHGLDTVAAAAGIDSAKLEKIDSLVGEHSGEILEAVEELQNKDGKELKKTARKAAKKVLKEIDMKEIKQLKELKLKQDDSTQR